MTHSYRVYTKLYKAVSISSTSNSYNIRMLLKHVIYKTTEEILCTINTSNVVFYYVLCIF